MVRIIFSPNNTEIAEKRDSSFVWTTIVSGDSNNITRMARKILNDPGILLLEYNTCNDTEEYIFDQYEKIVNEPSLVNISRYGFAKLLEISEQVA